MSNTNENTIPTPAEVAGMQKSTAITYWDNRPDDHDTETIYYTPTKIDRESPAFKEFAEAMEILFDHADTKRKAVIEACWGEIGTGLINDDLDAIVYAGGK
ncbi:hypothetical protein [Corynebacterium sputi]|uniref:hypothetical protein n=1 Tax=Corynebacterium sputi TaxID=489915 RepID=UPI00040A3BE1|nr:hypothetical protein [Corynebacterium sputi]